MSEVILHLGMPKSASTFLQNAVECGCVSYRGKLLVSPKVKRMGSNKELTSGHLYLLNSKNSSSVIKRTNQKSIPFLSFENFCCPDFKLTLQDIIRVFDIKPSDIVILWIRQDKSITSKKFYNEGIINGLKNEVRGKNQISVIEKKLQNIEKVLADWQHKIVIVDYEKYSLTENLLKKGFNLKPEAEELISNVTTNSYAPYNLLRFTNLLLGWFPLYRILLRYTYKRDIYLRLLVTSIPTWWRSLWRK